MLHDDSLCIDEVMNKRELGALWQKEAEYKAKAMFSVDQSTYTHASASYCMLYMHIPAID
jgi:hypothetical protein